jgi:hypothetical protein
MCNTPSEEIPNHMIVWLDLNIGVREDYKRLKAAFSSTTDPNHVNPVRLIDKEDDEINRAVGFEQINFEGVNFLLAAFTNVERCVDFLQENQTKKVFLITSGSMGRALLPLIKMHCKDAFTDPFTKQPCASVYVFCHEVKRQMDWMPSYPEYLAPPFDFDADLLLRMILDIAGYFVAESKRLLEEPSPNYSAVYNRLTWAHTLYDRYRPMKNSCSIREEWAEVNQLIEKVEKKMKEQADNEE